MPKKPEVFKPIDTRRIAINAIFIAMALIMFLIESQFPPILAAAPGAKMGLSNIFSLVGMIILGPVDAFVIVIVRCLLAVMFGTPASALMYALSGGIISLTAMFLCYQFISPHITIIAISVVGAVMHNITQVVVLCIQVQTWGIISYLPWLSVAGVAAGLIVGFTSYFIIKYLPINVYYKPQKKTVVISENINPEEKETDKNEN